MRGLEHLRRLGAHRTTHRMIRTDMHSTTSHASLSQGARRSHKHPTSQDWASPYAARNAPNPQHGTDGRLVVTPARPYHHKRL